MDKRGSGLCFLYGGLLVMGALFALIVYGDVLPEEQPFNRTAHDQHVGSKSASAAFDHTGTTSRPQTYVTVHIWTGKHAEDISWNVDGRKMYGPDLYQDDQDVYQVLTVSEGVHRLNVTDHFGDGWDGGYWELQQGRPPNNVTIKGGKSTGAVSSKGKIVQFCVGKTCGRGNSRGSCSLPTGVVLSMSLLGSATPVDSSASKATVQMMGHAKATAAGVEFDGDGDFIKVTGGSVSTYATDATFSLSFWMTKEECTASVYEYLYSHAYVSTSSDISPPRGLKNSNVNIYLGCEKSGGGYSSASGTVLRYNLLDAKGAWAQFDYPLHDAGNFDAITRVWVHVLLVVSANSVLTYDDGKKVEDNAYGYYLTSNVAANRAYPKPSALTKAFRSFSLGKEIFVGSRSDQHKDRHFKGKLAMVSIYDHAIDAAGAQCVFAHDEKMLPAVNQVTVTVRIVTKQYADEILWSIDSGPTIPAQTKYRNNQIYNTTISLPEGQHKINYADIAGDGWQGGYWEILEGDGKSGKVIAGGVSKGQVTGSGGDAGFCLGSACGSGKGSAQAKITVFIITHSWADEISWQMDSGTVFPGQTKYKDNAMVHQDLTLMTGEHTITTFDSFNDGWSGGYWEIRDCANKKIAGGATDGLVKDAGGEARFTVSTSCGSNSTSAPTSGGTPQPTAAPSPTPTYMPSTAAPTIMLSVPTPSPTAQFSVPTLRPTALSVPTPSPTALSVPTPSPTTPTATPTAAQTATPTPQWDSSWNVVG